MIFVYTEGLCKLTRLDLFRFSSKVKLVEFILCLDEFNFWVFGQILNSDESETIESGTGLNLSHYEEANEQWELRQHQIL